MAKIARLTHANSRPALTHSVLVENGGKGQELPTIGYVFSFTAEFILGWNSRAIAERWKSAKLWKSAKSTIQVLEEISKGASCEDILSYIEYSDDEFEDFLCAGSWKEVSNSFSPTLIPVYENLPQNIQFQYILAKQLYSHSFLLGWHNTIQVKTSVQLLILHALQISSSLIRHF